MSRHHLIVILAFAILAAGTTAHIFTGYSGGRATNSVHAAGTDDAYITYRYAQNLIEGNGLVFNPGEKVEGYSNFLYVLAMAVLHVFVPPDSIYTAGSMLNLLCLMLALWIFWRFARSRLGDGHAAVSALMFALCTPLWAWTAAGLETAPVLAAQMAVWVAVAAVLEDESRRRFWTLTGLLGLFILLRADGFLMPLIVLAYLVLRGRARLAMRTALALLPVVIVYFGWRLVYYGDLLPNTYHTKVTGPLIERIGYALNQLYWVSYPNALLIYAVILLFALGAAIIAFRKEGGRSSALTFELVFPFCLLLYWLAIGGDHFGERFLIVLYPMGILVFLDQFARALPAGRLVPLVVVLAIFQLSPLIGDIRFDYTSKRYDAWVTLGKFLGARYSNELLATSAAGKIPYFSRLPSIDMLGLTDSHIGKIETEHFRDPGHDKIDPEYVLSRQPDLIASWVFPSLDVDCDLNRESYLRAGYRLKFLLNTTRDPGGRRVQVGGTVAPRGAVIDVSGMGDNDRRRLISRGYDFAVLERVGATGGSSD